MNNQFDITKHKWSEPNQKVFFEGDSCLFLQEVKGAYASKPRKISKDDAIAIAKHFGLIGDGIELNSIAHIFSGESLKANRLIRESNEIGRLRETLAAAYVELSGKTNHSSDCATSNSPAMTPGKCDCFTDIPQSETTYKSHHLGEIGDIKDNELFNKEGDLHG